MRSILVSSSITPSVSLIGPQHWCCARWWSPAIACPGPARPWHSCPSTGSVRRPGWRPPSGRCPCRPCPDRGATPSPDGCLGRRRRGSWAIRKKRTLEKHGIVTIHLSLVHGKWWKMMEHDGTCQFHWEMMKHHSSFFLFGNDETS